MKKFIYIFFAVSILSTSCTKEEGCTDSYATNFNIDAENDDGSCVFGVAGGAWITQSVNVTGSMSVTFGGFPVLDSIINYTGSVQTYVIPDSVFSIDLDIVGAASGFRTINKLTSQPDSKGKGGRVISTMIVTPGDTLYLYVGGEGSSSTGGSGGWNGGGNTVIDYNIYRDGVLYDTTADIFYEDLNTEHDIEYCYVVSANYLSGESQSTNESCAMWVLAAPLSVSASGGNGFIQLDWTEPGVSTCADEVIPSLPFNTVGSNVGLSLIHI